MIFKYCVPPPRISKFQFQPSSNRKVFHQKIFRIPDCTDSSSTTTVCRTTNSFKEARQQWVQRKHQRKPWLTSIRLFSQQQPHVTRRFRRPLVVVRLRRPLLLCHCCQGTTTNFFHAYHRYSWDVLLKENWWRGKQDQHHHFSQLRTPNSKKELFPPLFPLGDEIVSANMVANFLSLFTFFKGFLNGLE